LDSVDVNEQSVDNVFLCNIKYHNSINEILWFYKINITLIYWLTDKD
jgi:hypothetical protein